MYTGNGIGLSREVLKAGEPVEIVYSGLLKTSGANNVKLHIGYNESWEDSQYIDMSFSEESFKAVITPSKAGMLNFAFTDPVGNWDNNSGRNYSFKVIASATKAKKEKSPEKTTGSTKTKMSDKKTLKSAKTEPQKALDEPEKKRKKPAGRPKKGL